MISSNPPAPEPLIKAAEVSRLLGIAQRSVYFMVREGKIPAVHIGRRVRFKPTEIRNWLVEQGEATPPPGTEFMPLRRALTSQEKLKLIQAAIFSVDDTLTQAEVIMLIASVFQEDPIVRIERARLPELLDLITPQKKPRKGRRR